MTWGNRRMAPGVQVQVQSGLIAPESRDALQTCGLTVGYGGRAVIADVDLSVGRGEVLCLVGPNGSGKSTLLKTIAAQISPLGGHVLLSGDDAQALRAGELAQRLSVMLTGRVSCEMLSCLDVVETGRVPYTNALGALRQADRAAVRRAMELTGSWELRERDFMQISDGQRQRVLLARAVAQEPQVLALDEPTSYLDIRHQLELLGVVRELARERGWACVLSLHELALAQKVADRVACVCDGHVQALGTPEEVLDAPTVGRVFDLKTADYDGVFGTVEDTPLAGPARVFVLGGAGAAAPSMRALRRERVSFCLGVLPENDLDCALGRRLTTQVVAVPAFCEVDEGAVQAGCTVLGSCEALVDCLGPEARGSVGACRAKLLEEAEKLGIPTFESAARYLDGTRSNRDAWRVLACDDDNQDAPCPQAEEVRP